MSSASRNKEKRARDDAEYAEREQARLKEERRRSDLTMWERIEEITDDERLERLKEVLHLFAQKLGLEQ